MQIEEVTFESVFVVSLCFIGREEGKRQDLGCVKVRVLNGKG